MVWNNIYLLIFIESKTADEEEYGSAKKIRKKYQKFSRKEDQGEFDHRLIELVMEREPLFNINLEVRKRSKEKKMELWLEIQDKLWESGNYFVVCFDYCIFCTFCACVF